MHTKTYIEKWSAIGQVTAYVTFLYATYFVPILFILIRITETPMSRWNAAMIAVTVGGSLALWVGISAARRLSWCSDRHQHITSLRENAIQCNLLSIAAVGIVFWAWVVVLLCTVKCDASRRSLVPSP